MSRAVVVRLALAAVAGLLEPYLELAWKCKAGNEASEACVWGRSLFTVSQWVALLVVVPVAYLGLVLLQMAWRRIRARS